MKYFCHAMTIAAYGLIIAGTIACGDGSATPDAVPICFEETRADTYSAGMSKIGANGTVVSLVDSLPAPPARDDNTWTLQVADDQGTPLDGLTLDATLWMPDHGHGTTAVDVTTPTANAGEYEIEPINLRMPGLWEVTIDIDDGVSLTDEVVFRFCIQG